MRRFLSTFKRSDDERGQVLILFAAGFVAFCGLVALSVDAGQLLYARTDLQKVADAAVLAGVQDLPDGSAAYAIATEYVGKNSGSSTTAVVEVGATHAPNDTITVTTTRRVNYTFLRILGVEGADVSAKAVGRVARYRGGFGLAPFALVASNDPNATIRDNPCFVGFDAWNSPIFQQGVECQLKGRTDGNQSDTGALALDGTGVSIFRETAANGTTGVYTVGQQVPTQTGLFSTPTWQGIEDRLSQPPPAGCPSNAYDDVLTRQADGSVTVNPDCADSPRIMIIPVVNQIDNPNPSTIIGFAFMYILRVEKIGGSEYDIYGHYVSYIGEVPGGVYEGLDGSGPILARMVD